MNDQPVTDESDNSMLRKWVLPIVIALLEGAALFYAFFMEGK